MDFTIRNIFNQEVTILEESYFNTNNLDIVSEAKVKNKDLIDGEIRSCHFSKFPPGHQDRPGLVIHRGGIGPIIMVLGSTKDDGRWKHYDENILVRDWREEGLKKETYANTGALVHPNEIGIGKRIGSLTQSDYDEIVEPVFKKLQKMQTDDLFGAFESVDYEYIIDLID